MGQKAVTRNLTGNPAKHSCEWTAEAKAQLNRRQPEPAKPGCQAGSKTDMGHGSVTGRPDVSGTVYGRSSSLGRPRRKVPS